VGSDFSFEAPPSARNTMNDIILNEKEARQAATELMRELRRLNGNVQDINIRWKGLHWRGSWDVDVKGSRTTVAAALTPREMEEALWVAVQRRNKLAARYGILPIQPLQPAAAESATPPPPPPQLPPSKAVRIGPHHQVYVPSFFNPIPTEPPAVQATL